MRTLPAGMQDHLDSGATTLCRCWRIVRRDGTVLGFTDHDETVTFGGTLFEADTGFTGSDLRSSLGLAVDDVEVEGALSSTRLDPDALAAGLFDGAAVEEWRVNWATPAQRLLLRKGHLGEVERGVVGFRAEVRGLAHKLQEPQGRIFGFTCDAVLGDARAEQGSATHTVRQHCGGAALRAMVSANADRHARDPEPVLADICAAGQRTLRSIAAELDARGILTRRCGQWHVSNVSNLLARLEREARRIEGDRMIASCSPQISITIAAAIRLRPGIGGEARSMEPAAIGLGLGSVYQPLLL